MKDFKLSALQSPVAPVTGDSITVVVRISRIIVIIGT